MPEEIPSENPAPKKRNERTEAKFLEDVDKLIAEAVRLGAEYDPPNPIAALNALQAKRDAVLANRTAHQTNRAKNEADRNKREMLYKPLRSDVGSLVEYAKSSGKPANDVEALRSIYRELRGERVGGGSANSVSHQSFATLADTFSRAIEQYETLDLKSNEAMYKTETLRDRLAAIRAANDGVIESNANADGSGETFDKAAYTDADSLMNGCVSAKSYIKSKYKTTGEPYKNISKTRFTMPARLR